MIFISYRRFDLEIKRLEKLYFLSIFSFLEARKNVLSDIKAGNIKNNDPFKIILDNNRTINIDGDIRHHMDRLKSQAPRYLRELIFVRAISALEVFLIDTVKEISSITSEPFKSDDEIIKFTKNQILSFKSPLDILGIVVKKECRKLNNGGFNEITKFYCNKLDIDYRKFSCGISKLEEYHDYRHLIVHRLGETDIEFKHKYSSSLKKIDINGIYLEKSLNDINSFVNQINLELSKKYLGVDINSIITKTSNSTRVCVIENNKNIINCVFDDNYKFSVEGVPFILKDILHNRVYKNENVVLSITGSRNVLDKYIEIIKEEIASRGLKIKYINRSSFYRKNNNV
ncbi:MAG: hypothetical protein WC241_01625 [Candidatus Paceibacterota bacterium]|jgi:hypothetical protein